MAPLGNQYLSLLGTWAESEMRLWHPEPKFYLNDKFLTQATGLHHSSRAGQVWVVHRAQPVSHKGGLALPQGLASSHCQYSCFPTSSVGEASAGALSRGRSRASLPQDSATLAQNPGTPGARSMAYGCYNAAECFPGSPNWREEALGLRASVVIFCL